jgi:hypothetical protein
MSDIVYELQEQLMPVLRAGDTARRERIVAECFAALPPSPFNIAIDLAVTNTPADIAADFDGFFRQEATGFTIGAAYDDWR